MVARITFCNERKRKADESIEPPSFALSFPLSRSLSRSLSRPLLFLTHTYTQIYRHTHTHTLSLYYASHLKTRVRHVQPCTPSSPLSSLDISPHCALHGHLRLSPSLSAMLPLYFRTLTYRCHGGLGSVSLAECHTIQAILSQVTDMACILGKSLFSIVKCLSQVNLLSEAFNLHLHFEPAGFLSGVNKSTVVRLQ